MPPSSASNSSSPKRPAQRSGAGDLGTLERRAGEGRNRGQKNELAAPPTRLFLFLCLLCSIAIFLFFWESPLLYPLRLLVTLLHESGHAIAAKVVGGRVLSVSISPGTGGLTVSQYPPTLFKQLLVASGGYLGSAFAGATLLAAAGRMRSGRLILGGLAAWLAVVGLLWVRLIPPQLKGAAAHASGYSRGDGLFTLGFILSTCALLVALGWAAPLWARRAVIVVVASLSCLMALEDLKLLFFHGNLHSSSDAASLAALTGIPAMFWSLGWTLIAVVAIAVGFRFMLKQGRPQQPKGTGRLKRAS